MAETCYWRRVLRTRNRSTYEGWRRYIFGSLVRAIEEGEASTRNKACGMKQSTKTTRKYMQTKSFKLGRVASRLAQCPVTDDSTTNALHLFLFLLFHAFPMAFNALGIPAPPSSMTFHDIRSSHAANKIHSTILSRGMSSNPKFSSAPSAFSLGSIWPFPVWFGPAQQFHVLLDSLWRSTASELRRAFYVLTFSSLAMTCASPSSRLSGKCPHATHSPSLSAHVQIPFMHYPRNEAESHAKVKRAGHRAPELRSHFISDAGCYTSKPRTMSEQYAFATQVTYRSPPCDYNFLVSLSLYFSCACLCVANPYQRKYACVLRNRTTVQNAKEPGPWALSEPCSTR